MNTIAIINVRNLIKPYILKSIENNCGALVYENQTKIKEEFINDKNSNIMRYVLDSVVAKGSSSKLRIQLLNIF